MVGFSSRTLRQAAHPRLSTPLPLPFSLSSLTIGAITYDSPIIPQLFASSPNLRRLSSRIDDVRGLLADDYVEGFPLTASSLRTLRLEILGPDGGRLPKSLLPLLRQCSSLRSLELVDRGLRDLVPVANEPPPGVTTLVLQPMLKELLLDQQATLEKALAVPGMERLAVLRLVGLGRESREREGHAKDLWDACEGRGLGVDFFRA